MLITNKFQKDVTVVGERSRSQISVPQGTEELFYIAEYGIEGWRVWFFIGEEPCKLPLNEFCSVTGLDEEGVKAEAVYLDAVFDDSTAWFDHVLERDPEERRRFEEENREQGAADSERVEGPR
jgi:hypothetical protein